MRTILMLVPLLVPSWLIGQDTRGIIAGTVNDSQGSTIAGATVTVTNTGTATSIALTSNTSGYYEAPLLLPGTYSVSAEFKGFKRSVRSGITLGLGDQLQINMQLEIGGTSESITVTADAAMLDTSSVSTGRNMTHREVMDLPVIGNNMMALTRMAPGVQVPGTTQFLVQGQVGGGSAYNAPGNVGGNEWSIDGASTNGTDRRASIMPSPDVVDEFKIETSNFDASFGHATGLGISMSTKSGANQFHGTSTFQYMNQRWNAASFFVKQSRYSQIAAARAAGNLTLAEELADRPMLPPGRTMNYQATLSGPVWIPKLLDGRNRVFFFLGFSELKNRQSARPSDINYTVPTVAMRNGDFSNLLRIDPVRYQLYDPLTTRPDLNRPGHFVRDPFPGNIIPPDRIRNPIYNFYAQRMPLPNNDNPNRDPENNYLATGMPNTVDYRSWNNRVDFIASQRHRFFLRWFKSSFLEGAQDFTYETEPGLMNWDEKRPAFSGAADWTFAMNATTIFNVTADTNWFLQQNQRLGTRKYKPSDVGLPSYLDAKCGDTCVMPRILFPGMTFWNGDMVMGTTVDPGTKGRQQAIKLNVTDIRGAHTLRTGVDFRQHFRTQVQNGGFTSGTFSFGNSLVRRDEDGNTPAANLALGWASFMLGMPTAMSVDTNDSFALMSPYYAWYGQDTWRVSRTVTLTLGLRLEYERGATERYNRAISYFDPNLELPITTAAQAAYARSPLPELPPDQFIVRGGSVYAGQNGVPRELWRSELMWLPRLSGAWQVNQKTVVRGGYGTYFDTINVMNQAADQYGFARATNTVLTNDFGQTWNAGDPKNGISPLADPFPVRADGTRFDMPLRDVLGPTARVGQGFTFNDYDRRHARVQRWRLGAQRELSNSMMVEAAYWGQWADRISIARRLDALPGQYWATGMTRNAAVATEMDRQVPNPFHISNFESLRASDPTLYQHLSTLGQFTTPTIQKHRLLRPFPHMNGLTDATEPLGKARTHALEVNFQRRFSRGFNLNASYSRTLQERHDILENEFEGEPTRWWPSDTARPHRFTATGILELPFGRGRAFLQDGLLNHLFGGWQIAATYEFQPGPLLAWGNLFYRGDLNEFEADATSGDKSLSRWFNTELPIERVGAQQPAAYHVRVFPRFLNGLRADGLNQWNANLMREFRLTERVRLQLRGDVI
ncbi:MAG TPA: carboxypeptidase-like regulatory domain-containing protein, partial [Bryobacteraceae bacterium]|nr:carboxypeptidase-like regulatory domain-containing protein [Bryobacteraceae bacterium]